MSNYSELNKSGEVYSKESYVALDIGQHRKDYPGVTKPFTDEQLFNLVMSTDDDMEGTDWIKFFQAHSPVIDVSVAGNNGIIDRTGAMQAMAFALKGGSALNSLLSGIADQKAAERMGSIKAMCFFVSNYTDEELTALPVVGSEQGKTGNLPYDRYSKEIQTPEGKRKVPGSFYTDIIHAMPEYETIQQRKRWIDGIVAEGETVPDEIANIAKTGDGTALKQTLNDRISDMRVGLTKGAMLFKHSEEIAALNPDRIKVKMPWRAQYVLVNGEKVKDDTGAFKTELVVYGSKIRLIDPLSEFEDKVYSVSSFLQLKPEDDTFAKLDKDARTIVTLDKTGARPPKVPGSPGKDTDVKVPVTVEQVLTQFNALASGIDQETDTGERIYAALLVKASGKDADARETRMAIAKIALALDALWTVIRPMHIRDVEAAAAAAIKEQAAAK